MIQVDNIYFSEQGLLSYFCVVGIILGAVLF